MGYVVATTIGFVFLQIFQCTPVDYKWVGWMNADYKDKCINVQLLAYLAASCNISQEVAILVLPLPYLIKLQTGIKTKLGIMAMFSLGVFIVITSCIRLHYMVTFGETSNPSWDYTDPVIWSAVEACVSIIVACLPAVRVLITQRFPGFLSSSSRKKGSSLGYNRAGHPAQQEQNSATMSKNKFVILGSCADGSADGSAGDSQIELQLQLGDKIHGRVNTEISGGSPCSTQRPKNAIRVRTETISRVDEDEWSSEQRSRHNSEDFFGGRSV